MSWDATWEDVFRNRDWGKYPSESLIRFVARNYYSKSRNEIKILEVGCGTGANLWFIAREGMQAYGVDGSATAIEKAKARMDEESVKVNLKVGDIIKLDYPDNYFDAVIDVECLSHNSIENCKKIFSEINRVLKPQGKFYSRTFSERTTISANSKKLSDHEYTEIKDGAFAGCGYVKLLSDQRAKDLYGGSFNLNEFDTSEYTYNSGSIKIAELVVVCSKK